MVSRSPLAWICGALLLALLVSTGPASAQDATSWGYKLPYELMSPFCPGRTLAQCTSPQAAELRQWILLQEAAGATREEVEATLLERFGDAILSAPKAEGWGLSAYVLPAVFFVGAGGLVLFFLQRIVRSSPKRGAAPLASTPPPPRGSEQEEKELERLVDEELGLVR